MKYPFTKCMNPQKIRNPHTGEWLKVSCGKCEACLNSKSSYQSLKVKMESLAHKYCVFFTLTYDNDNIFRVKMIPSGDNENLYHATVITDRLGNDGEILFDIELDETAMEMLRSKFQHEEFPILCKRDAQLFIKRFRKHLSKYSNEKIRYYITGEYGPQHYRPHMHGLLWFDRDETFAKIGECISASWKLGRLDWSLSRGNCAQYIAQYVAGNIPLPRVYQFDETQPFALHSFYLGEAVLATKSKDVPKEEFGNFVRRSIHFGSASCEFTVWRSFESRFFPKCRRFSQLNESQCVTPYRAYEFARDWTNQTAIGKQAKQIIEMHSYIKEDKFFDWLNDEFDFTLPYEKLYTQIYSVLSVSKHFLNEVCRNQSLGEIKNRIHYIKEYYHSKDYQYLSKQLKLEDEILRNPSLDDINISLFFDIVEPKALSLQNDFQPYVLINESWVYNESKLVKQFRAEAYKISHDSIKHKKLNDLNQIFFNL